MSAAAVAAEERRRVLDAFNRVIRLETHNVVTSPELLWQQSYNELQWEHDAVQTALDEQLPRRTAPGARPWLRRRTRLRRSGVIGVLAGHNSWITSCAVSGDGTYVVSGSLDRTLRTWDVETGRPLMTFPCEKRVLTCALSPDGAFVVSGGDEGTLRIWDPSSGRLIDTLESHPNEVGACTVAPDGSFLVTVGGSVLNTTLKIWALEPLGLLRALDGCALGACAVSPDGSLVVSPAEAGSVRIWDLSSGAEPRTLHRHWDGVTACDVSPNGLLVVSASKDRTLKIWDLETGEALRTLEGHADWVTACAFSPDGASVVSGSLDRTLRIWDAETGQERRTLHGHRDAVTSCAVSPCGSLVVSGSRDRSLILWDTELAAEMSPGHTGDVTACAMSPNGSFVVSASVDATLRTWNPTTGEDRQTLRGHTGPVFGCSVGPDGSSVVSAGDDETVRVWDAETGQHLRTFAGHRAFDCEVSRDGSFIVSAGWDTTLKIWDLSGAAREPRALEGHASSVLACAVTPDNAFIVSTSRDGTARIWDLETGEPLRTLDGLPVDAELDLLSPHLGVDARGLAHLWERDARPIVTCAVSADGSLLILDGCFGTLRVCDLQTGEVLFIIGGGVTIRACAVSPDVSLLVSGREDGVVTVWGANDGRELATIPLPGEVTCVAFHPHRPVIACGDNVGSVNIIELVGLEYGPLVVTAARDDAGVSVRCPSCRETFAVEQASLGCEIVCSACKIRLRVNPFLVKPHGIRLPVTENERARGRLISLLARIRQT